MTRREHVADMVLRLAVARVTRNLARHDGYDENDAFLDLLLAGMKAETLLGGAA